MLRGLETRFLKKLKDRSLSRKKEDYMERDIIKMEPVGKLNEFAMGYGINQDREMEFITELANTLLDVGITPTYKGFNYIIDAVRIISRKGFAHILVTKDIYAPLAKLYDTNPELIEHCIRTAVKKGFIKTDDSMQRKSVFGSADKCPTNYSFLINLSRYVYYRFKS